MMLGKLIPLPDTSFLCVGDWNLEPGHNPFSSTADFFHGRILAPQHDGHFLPLVGVQIVASIMLLPIFGFLQQVFLYSMLNMLITSL